MRVAIGAEQLRRGASGGIGTYTEQLLNGLAESGHSVLAVLSKGSRPAVLNPRVRTVEAPVPHRLASRLWERDLLRLPATLEADIVHHASFNFAALNRRKPILQSSFVHDLAWRSHPEFYTQRGLRFHDRALNRVIESAGPILVPSRAVADSLCSVGESLRSRIVITGEGADHLPVSVGPPRAREYILSVGTLEPRKNLVTIFGAYAAYRERMGAGSADLVVIGPDGWSGPNHSGLPKQIPDGVVLLGAVSPLELANLYTYARVFVFMPRAEGYGLPAVEAMFCGAPVVCATTVPSVTEPDVDSASWVAPAHLLDPLDVHGLAKAMGEIVSNTARRDELIALGTEHVRNRTWRNAIGRHLHAWGGQSA